MVDRITSWFIKNVIIPRHEIIDNPGFVLMKPFSKGQYQIRQAVFPESLLIDLENEISTRYGRKGEQTLYSLGKRFGYRMCHELRPPLKSEISKKEFKRLSDFFVKFIECTYAHKLKSDLKLEDNEFDLFLDGFVVCRKNGKGRILTEGGIAGVWSYVLGDNSIEAIQTKCQGRGDSKCNLVCAPYEALKNRGLKPMKETNLSGLEVNPKYEILNGIHESQYSHNSLQDMLDIKFFEYSGGMLMNKNQRYFILDTSLLYLIESDLTKLKGAEEILFDCAFRHGKAISEAQGKNSYTFIPEYLSSCGWGDILITKNSKGKYEVTSVFFPWTKFAEKSKFVLFRGMVSGLLSGAEKKKISLNKVSANSSSGFLVVRVN